MLYLVQQFEDNSSHKKFQEFHVYGKTSIHVLQKLRKSVLRYRRTRIKINRELGIAHIPSKTGDVLANAFPHRLNKFVA